MRVLAQVHDVQTFCIFFRSLGWKFLFRGWGSKCAHDVGMSVVPCSGGTLQCMRACGHVVAIGVELLFIYVCVCAAASADWLVDFGWRMVESGWDLPLEHLCAVPKA